ncbi:DUF6387 family protein [Shewanella xiamenensis]|uniref:DUF6387 family protein n=1 Tax=Shewanella xiamenensis TaxID=332186 RepID=UPI0024A6455E|nr:DUF6387 family protein [Shewanella xiamenensis]MDI5837818.1 DUF6387 family protein [Shewanella xiamenensis]MDI5841157.1 DUF6387 family protein [Shewanella xiamenensis]MDI5845656.1 DUF6387 family protein [Shewanella xiamenensis]MDI5848495.1 DUF6387 family protein [Shewanella xiamenensis]MDI5852849.1 DUF6387 family protein [Shewanella xiamenensis]
MKTDVPISTIVKNSGHPKWPMWFAIENYDCLTKLTGKEFLNELEIRLALYHAPIFANGRKRSDDRKWQQILNGHILINQSNGSSTTSPAAKALTPIELMEACDRIKPRSLESDAISYSDPRLIPIEGSQSDLAILAVNLEQADDTTILNEVAYLLRQLRQQLTIPAPKRKQTKQANIQTFKKALTYKVIPYLDLMLYCHNHMPLTHQDDWQALSFTQPALVRLLFNNELDIESFKKTHIPFYKKFLNDDEFLMRQLSNTKQDSYFLGTQMQYI